VGVIGVGFGIGQNHLQGIHENATRITRSWPGPPTYIACAATGQSQSRPERFRPGRRLQKDARAQGHRRRADRHTRSTARADDARFAERSKHVYCEKPLTRYLDEAFKVYDAVKKSDKVFQIGSQGCSAGGYHKCAELINAGKIGQLVWAQAWYSRNSLKGEWNYAIEKDATAANIDWERWLGPVKKREPFSGEHFHRWRKYFQYCAGPMGDLAPHRLHPLMLATGKPEFPVRVTCIGTKNVHTDLNVPGTPERDVPEHAQLLAEFPSGLVIMVTCCTVNGSTPGLSLFGHKANLNIDATGGKVDLVPQREYGDEIDPENFANLQPEEIRVHEKNWFDCIRTGKKPNADIDLAIKVQTVISLAEMSDRLKITCLFDEKTRKIKDASGKEFAPITYGTLPIS